MTPKRFGEVAPRNFNKEVVSDGRRIPGLGWEIDETTQREIEDIERNRRNAEQRSGTFLLD